MNWSALGIGIVGGIAVAFILYLIARARGWIKIGWTTFFRFHHLLYRIRSAGVENFYVSRDDYVKYRHAPKLTDYLRLAHDSIHISAYWMAHGNEAEGAAQEIANLVRPPKNLDTEIGVIDPTGTCIPELSRYLGISIEELRSRICYSLECLHKARLSLGPELQKKFRIKVYSTIPAASVIMLDANKDSGRTQIEFKPYHVPRHYSFAMELTRPGSSLYDLCTKAWLDLLRDAEDFDPDRHLINCRTNEST